MPEPSKQKPIDFLEAKKRKRRQEQAARRKKRLIWLGVGAAVLLILLFLLFQLKEALGPQDFWSQFSSVNLFV